jgi:hypothetical protein
VRAGPRGVDYRRVHPGNGAVIAPARRSMTAARFGRCGKHSRPLSSSRGCWEPSIARRCSTRRITRDDRERSADGVSRRRRTGGGFESSRSGAQYVAVQWAGWGGGGKGGRSVTLRARRLQTRLRSQPTKAMVSALLSARGPASGAPTPLMSFPERLSSIPKSMRYANAIPNFRERALGDVQEAARRDK